MAKHERPTDENDRDLSAEIDDGDANDIASLPDSVKDAAKKSIPTPEDTPLP